MPSAATLIRSSLPRRSFVLAERALRVVGRVAARALVDRRVAVRGERVGVVAGREVQVALGVEVDLAAGVAADAAVGGDLEDLLLGREVERAGVGQLEARELVVALVGVEATTPSFGRVAGGVVERRRVVDVDPAVGREVGVDRDRPAGRPRRASRRGSCRPATSSRSASSATRGRRARCAARAGPAAPPSRSARRSCRRPWRAR